MDMLDRNRLIDGIKILTNCGDSFDFSTLTNEQLDVAYTAARDNYADKIHEVTNADKEAILNLSDEDLVQQYINACAMEANTEDDFEDKVRKEAEAAINGEEPAATTSEETSEEAAVVPVPIPIRTSAEEMSDEFNHIADENEAEEKKNNRKRIIVGTGAVLALVGVIGLVAYGASRIGKKGNSTGKGTTPTTFVKVDPTNEPTNEPTKEPTKEPTQAPTKAPTKAPTQAPTEAPTPCVTQEPTVAPTPRFENPSESIENLGLDLTTFIDAGDEVFVAEADYARWLAGKYVGPVEYKGGIINEDDTFTFSYNGQTDTYASYEVFREIAKGHLVDIELKDGVWYPRGLDKTK